MYTYSSFTKSESAASDPGLHCFANIIFVGQ